MIDPVKLLAPLLFVGLAACAAPPPPPSSLSADLQERIDAGARTLVVLPANSGLAIGLLRDGIPHVLGYGRRSKDNAGPPEGDTLFEIGSMTKTFTGTLLWQAARDGTLALDDPIGKFLPKTVHPPVRNGKDITLLHLATHTSGLPRLPANLVPRDATNPYADYSVPDLYDGLDSLELAHDPGERYEYSNLGMGLLGHLLALRAGKPYEALVLEKICAPLGLPDTRIALSDDQKRRLAPGHAADGSEAPNWDFPALAGAGALRSTAHDLLRYLEAHLDDAYAGMQAPRATLRGGMKIGLAWHLLPVASKGSTIVWHNGASGGYRCWAGFVRRTRTAVVVLTNSTADVDLLGVTLLKLLQDVQ
jgi:CubicO group peptidase (beta-lactamase class C family)